MRRQLGIEAPYYPENAFRAELGDELWPERGMKLQINVYDERGSVEVGYLMVLEGKLFFTFARGVPSQNGATQELLPEVIIITSEGVVLSVGRHGRIVVESRKIKPLHFDLQKQAPEEEFVFGEELVFEERRSQKPFENFGNYLPEKIDTPWHWTGPGLVVVGALLIQGVLHFDEVGITLENSWRKIESVIKAHFQP